MNSNTIIEKNAGIDNVHDRLIENSHAANRFECYDIMYFQLASTIKNFSKTRSMVLEPNTNVSSTSIPLHSSMP